jgi:predicted small lipoprotein YifL
MLPAAALSSALLLSACGIKGPLYLPEQAQRPAPAADHSKPVPAATPATGDTPAPPSTPRQ